MGRKSGAERGGAQASHVPGLGRAFEAVHHHNLSGGLARRPLRFQQDLHARLTVDQAALRGDIRAGPSPVVAENCLEVRIPKQRDKRDHRYFTLTSVTK
jgi:hypothetical protein